ncbi:MAG: DegT/DnrJ/EryC1/StrS family aminotransferase [Chthoniobacterales bacterium]|nr:DegT/DnrJ/EryC1/StrS family aminotransferase [Chthoniobacterales bacterium]
MFTKNNVNFDKYFLIKQYNNNKLLDISHNYLQLQFKNIDIILDEIRNLVIRGDFTLGEKVHEFEDKICKRVGSKFCVGVGSGTDAITLGLKACGVGFGDEVITTPYTFFGTIGGIYNCGAEPVFADVGTDFNIDPEEIEKKVTTKTKAIVPVHWAGLICEMDKIKNIAIKYNLKIVEDACHCIDARKDGFHAGLFGDVGCFSLHPLKNLNVWGDGGFIITNNEEIYEKLLLLRNHGQKNRNEIEIIGHNSRLDSIQAIVAIYVMDNLLDNITKRRIENSKYLTTKLTNCIDSEIISCPVSDGSNKHVYHLYCLRIKKKRDELLNFLLNNKIDAKVHYPIPMHLQKPFIKKYKLGDFPIAEMLCKEELSLPVHEFITEEHLDTIVEKIRVFFSLH